MQALSFPEAFKVCKVCSTHFGSCCSSTHLSYFAWYKQVRKDVLLYILKVKMGFNHADPSIIWAEPAKEPHDHVCPKPIVGFHQ